MTITINIKTIDQKIKIQLTGMRSSTSNEFVSFVGQ